MTKRFERSTTASVIEHMNNDHADAVLLYARHFAGLKDATRAVLIDVDRSGMILEVHAAQLTRARIEFGATLTSEDDVRPMLVKMAREARSALA